MYNKTILQTERFKIVCLTPDLVGIQYLNWFKEKEKIQYISNNDYSDLEDLKIYVHERVISSNALLWGIFDNNNNHIGNIKYEPVNLDLKYAVLGILIGSSEWRGKKVAKETIIATANFMKHEYGLTVIALGVELSNEAAIKAYRDLGFKDSPGKYIKINPGGLEMILELS